MANDLDMTPVDGVTPARHGIWKRRFATAAETPGQWYRLEVKVGVHDVRRFAVRDGYKVETFNRRGTTYFRVLAD